MITNPFVHLHLHTCYSLLDGACRITDLMNAVQAHGMPAVAMTDHGVMYGTIEFYKAARERGINPIIGCEAYITTGSRLDRANDHSGARTHHLVLLAENATGYHNLVKLISAAHLEGFYYKPRIDKDLLARHAQGLIGMAACLKGEVTSHLAQENFADAVTAAGSYAEIFGKDNFFLEIQDHGIPEQRKVNTLLGELSKKTGLSIVATNDVHYLAREHAEAHEVLLCLQTQTVLSDPKRMRYQSNEFYLKSADEMRSLFREFPDAVDITARIAERCHVEIELGRLHFPKYESPPGVSQKQYLYDIACAGIRKRYGIHDPQHPADDRERAIMKRLFYELDIIDRTGFVNYFLVVWDFIRYALDQGIPVGPGRGSGGGSVVAYALEIIDIDPLRYNLIFERFLNPERVSPPDFDIDFCQFRRGEVIEYVKNKYGRSHVAQIITFGSLGAKTVIRDVGRVLEIPFSKCDQLSKMIPEDPKMTLAKALEQSPEFKHAATHDEDCARILRYAPVMEGLFRNPGTHAAGVVIGEKPLDEIVPLACDKDKQPVTQFAKEPVEEVGLLKMDFLGLKTLTVIRETTDLVRRTRGITINFDTIPYDDKPTYELFCRADTIGVFQLESGGMQDLIRRIGINNIEELIAVIALYRPGPMEMLPDYIERKSGRAAIHYDHPDLEPILRETYGVMVYQEQVQQAANILAGYSLGEADILRRAMGKKKREVMDAQRANFIAGCKKTKNIDRDLAGRIFDNIAQFAGYGFNKAHTTGYAIVSYRTAYLKANYPAEFMSALISSEIGNFDKLPDFIAEAENMGLKLLPPDVNASETRFQPEADGIRYGLAGIKNVGVGAAEAIVAERQKNGPFAGLVDFCCRIDAQLVNKKVLESLVRCGAFDATETNRARLFNGIDFAMGRAAEALADRRSGQRTLFDLMAPDRADAARSEVLPECDPWRESEMLAGERELLGIYMTGHPLKHYTFLLEHFRLATLPQIAELEDRTMTRLGGIVSQMTKKVTKKKESMAILQLEDLDGTCEVLVFPETFSTYGANMALDKAILVCGEVSRRDDQPKILAHEVYALDDAPRLFSRQLTIHVATMSLQDATLDKIQAILRLHPGKTKVVLCLQYPSGERVFIEADKSCYVLPSETLIKELERELGEKAVFLTVDPSPCHKPRPARNNWPRNGASGKGKTT